jgi:hypothetical protein
MKKIMYLLLIAFTASCKTASIKNKEYKVSNSTVELGSIGTVTSLSKFKYNYDLRLFPKFEKKIRLDVQILPFNKEINKVYLSKKDGNQSIMKINYVDSLPEKPKFVTISFMDYGNVVEELNGTHNKNVFNYLKDVEKGAIITGLAVLLPDADIARLQQADAYYLVNDQESKYGLVLFKDGKKIDLVNLQAATALAYTTGKFCWAVNDRHTWYIGDIVNDDKSCLGTTRRKIEEKEETNLFKL